MNLQIINDTAADLANESPWLVGKTVVALNLTAGSLVVTGATCGASTSATAAQPVVLKRYVKVSTAATMFLLTSQ
jgi:hypothetical protein